MAKLKKEIGGLSSQMTQIKEKFGVEVEVAAGKYLLVGDTTDTDKDYLEIVVATLDHKCGQASAPANVVVVENKMVTWKFFGQDAILLKNLFDEDLGGFSKLNAVVSGLNTRPLVVEIICAPKLHQKIKVEIEKMQNELKKLWTETVKVPKSKIVQARQFATSMTDKSTSIYIYFDAKMSELCMFGKKYETVTRALNEWRASVTKPKNVTSITVTGNGGKLQRNEGNKLTLDENTTHDLSRPQMEIPTTSQQTSVPLRTPLSAVIGSESEIPQHSVADGGRLQHNESNSLTRDENPTLDLKIPQQGSVPLRMPPSAVSGSEFSVPHYSVAGSGTSGQYHVPNIHAHDRPMSAQFMRPNASQDLSQQHMSQSLRHNTNTHQEQVSFSTAINATNEESTSQIPKESVLKTKPGEKLDRSNHVTENSSQNRNPHYSASAGVVPRTSSQISYGYQIGKMDVKVYSKSVTEITGMDAIVNAANEHLQHGGGVAYYISQAAGSSMDQECRQFVSKKGPLRVTENFVSKPGRMRCKGIIHAVGPLWWYYVDDQEECARDLYRTVMNVLDEAGKRGYRRIAMSAISAGIFEVPKQLCAEMYVKAFQDFEHRKPGLIQEVHFIDIDPEILGLVINAHLAVLADPNCLSFSNAKKYARAQPHHPDTCTGGVHEIYGTEKSDVQRRRRRR